MDEVIRAVILALPGPGVIVTHERTSDGRHRAKGVDRESGHMYIVTDATLYGAVCQVAQHVGFDLEDG